MRKVRKASIKQKKFVQALVKTGNATDAVLASYNTTNRKSAQVLGSQNLDKPEVQAELEKALAKNNITLDKVTGNINNLANEQPYKPSSDVILKSNIELLKLMKAYPERVNKSVSYSIKQNVSNKSFSELIEHHKQRRLEIDEIIG